MRHYLIIVFIFIIQSLSAATYYVAPDGLDSNQGTKDKPWATWGKGFSSTIPGDTVYK